MPKQDAPCMFCGGLPCACGGGTTKKSSRSKPKVNSPAKSTKTSPASMPPVNDTEASKEDVFGAIPEPVKPRFKTKSPLERDLSYECALRNLREIVSEKDQRWIDRQLHHPYPQDVDRRVAQWKESRGS